LQEAGLFVSERHIYLFYYELRNWQTKLAKYNFLEGFAERRRRQLQGFFQQKKARTGKKLIFCEFPHYLLAGK
jgi:hypothetical protein